jgi:general secretion pathway protein A
MYTTFFRFFGLRENPFNINPDPGYLYLDQRIQTLLDDVASAIQARKGLIILTGEPGTGKTTLVNRLMQWLKEQKTPTAFIFNPHLELNELFDLLFANFGIPTDPRHPENPWTRLHRWLIDQYRMDMNAVVILDEAQGLPVPLLAEIRLLLNQQIANEGLMQIVLSGQPELEEKLKRPELRQIRQRISLRCRTTALTLQQAHGYIRKRIRLAGGISESVFAPEAINAAYQYAQGIPRLMNLLSERAMIQAYLGHTQPVPASLVEEAARQLQFDDVKPVVGRSRLEANLSTDSAARPATVELLKEERKPLPVAIPVVRESPKWAVFESAISDGVKLASQLPSASPKLTENHTQGDTVPHPVSELRAKTDSIQELVVELTSGEAISASPAPQPRSRKPQEAISGFGKEKGQRAVPDFLNPRPLLLRCRSWGRELRAALGVFSRGLYRRGREALALAKLRLRQRNVRPVAGPPRVEAGGSTGSPVGLSTEVAERTAAFELRKVKEERKTLPVAIPVVRASTKAAVFEPAVNDGVRLTSELPTASPKSSSGGVRASSAVPQPTDRKPQDTVSSVGKEKGQRVFSDFLNLRPFLLKCRSRGRELRAALGVFSRGVSRTGREVLALARSRVWQRKLEPALRWLRGPFLAAPSNSIRASDSSELAKSLIRQGNVQAAIRWLQQPFPTLKLHRRAGH